MLAGGAEATIIPAGVRGFITCKILCCVAIPSKLTRLVTTEKMLLCCAAQYMQKGETVLLPASRADAANIKSSVGGFIA